MYQILKAKSLEELVVLANAAIQAGAELIGGAQIVHFNGPEWHYYQTIMISDKPPAIVKK